MIFGRNRQVRNETVILPEHLRDPRDEVLTPEERIERSAERGPWDLTERAPEDRAGYIQLGSLWIPAVKDMRLRLDLEGKTKRIIGVTVTLGSSALQVQAFAAPRSPGLWEELTEEIAANLAKTDGAQVDRRRGPFGAEVRTRVPAKMPDGSPGWQVARFIGAEGPRWVVRGLISGEAAFKDEAAGALEDVFSRVLVDRGDAPLPPRELLPLKAPENLRRADPESRRARRERQGTAVPERGPEITETR